MKNLLLFRTAQPGKQRQDLRITQMSAVEHFAALPDLPFSGQKHQNIAPGIKAAQLLHRTRHMFLQFLNFKRRQKNVLHRKCAPLHLDDRHISEKFP